MKREKKIKYFLFLLLLNFVYDKNIKRRKSIYKIQQQNYFKERKKIFTFKTKKKCERPI